MLTETPPDLALFLHNPLPMWVYALSDLRFLEVNHAATRVYGFSRDEFLSMTIFDIRTEDDRVPLRQNLESARQSWEHSGPWRHRRKDGSELEVNITSHTLAYRGTDAVLVVVNDVTEQMRTERALINSERRFRSVAELAKDAIVVADATGTVVFWNVEAAKMFGHAEGDIIGQPLTRLMPERFHAPHRAGFARYLSTREPRVIGQTVELSGMHADGHEFPIELSISAWTIDQDTFFTSVIRDITSRQHLEETLRQAQKMEAIGRLAGGLAHDFNNLLTVMLGNCQFLGAGLRIEDPLREHLLVIERAARSASSMTRQLLAFSRKQIIQPTVFDANRLITDLSQMLKRLIGDDITLTLQLDPALVSIEADQSQIEQILINLAVNARDAMPTGGRLTIATSNATLDRTSTGPRLEAAPGRYALLSMTDSGVGIAPEVQARLFEPFFTTKSPGDGTGLGLASVYGIVEQNGGSISVQSEVGHGSTFRIYWPMTEKLASPIAPAGRDAMSGTETILLVEDHPAVRQMACQTLIACGYTVLEAANGEMGLRLAQQNPRIDLLLTDVVMPGLSGPMLAQSFHDLHPDARVLFMSGYTDETIIRYGVLHGMVPYLEKPYTPEILAAKVRSVLDRVSPGLPSGAS